MANRYWVGGGSSANWNATGNTNWGTASNTRDNASVPGSADDVFFDGVGFGASNSTLSANITVKSVNFTGYANTLTHSSNAQLTIQGGNCTFSAGMTYSPAAQTSSIFFTTTGTLTTGGQLMYNIGSTAGGFTLTLGDNLSFVAQKDAVLQGNCTIGMNGKSINGNSATNRLLIRSATVGTSRKISSATTSFSYADFMDIQFSSASSLDLSAITGLSGDCGGNTITGGGSTLTFTTSATQTWSGTTGGNWSANAWTSRVPLPQDDVVMGIAWSASQTVTADMPRLGRSIDWTGATGTPTFTLGRNVSSYGGLTQISGMNRSGNFLWEFRGRGSYNLTSAGKTFYQLSVFNPSGTLTLQDSVISNNDTLSINAGTFSANNFNVQGFQITVGATTAATINMGSGTWACNRSTTNNWQCSSGSTVNANTSTISLTNSNGFAGGGKTYYKVNFNSNGGGTVTGSNTFTEFNLIGTSITLTSTTTQTVGKLTATGTSGSNRVISASTGGSAATISSSNSIPNNCEYITITDITASQRGVFFYGGHSTINSGVTNWAPGNSSDMFYSVR